MPAEQRCEYCGAPAAGNYCAQCGQQLGASHDAPVLLGTHTSDQKPVQRVRQIPSTKKLAIVGVVAFFGLAILFELMKAPPQISVPDEAAEARFSSAQVARVVGSDGSSPWMLLAVDSSGLIRVDPSTGEVSELGADLTILGRSDEWIFLQTRRGDVIAADPPSLAQSGPVSIPEPINDVQYSVVPLSFPLLSSTPDHIWLRELDGPISEVNVLTGETRQQVATSVLLDRGIVPTSPRFTSPQAGGIYRLDQASRYRLIADGTVLAEIPGSVLVQECSTELGCSNRWLDLDVREEVQGLAAPTFRAGALEVRPIAASRFVASRTTERVEGGNGSTVRLDRTEVLDLASGQNVDLHSAEIEPLWADQVDISPDAQLIAAVRNLELYLRNTSNDVAVRVEVQVRPGSAVAFVRSEN